MAQGTFCTSGVEWLSGDQLLISQPLQDIFGGEGGARFGHWKPSFQVPVKLSLDASSFNCHSPQDGVHPPFGQGARKYSSTSPSPSPPRQSSQNPILVRDFILDSLYNPKYGYFASQEAVVGRIPEPIDFSQLWGRPGYTKLLSKLYREIGSSWLTPVEVFQPWYGYALAEFIRQNSLGAKEGGPQLGAETPPKRFGQSGHIVDEKGTLRIYEIGGGCGTCALNVLDYFEQKSPEIYKRMQYTSIEISESLAAEQRKTVSC